MLHQLTYLLHINITDLVTTLGYVGLIAIIFCETGLFFGCFFPGDSLLFTAGLLATRGFFNLWILIPSLLVAAILGYTLAYWFGDKLGNWLLKRPDSFFFKKKYITQAHDFYERYGAQAIILCRLIPVVRTFCPIVAGMGKMSFKRFTMVNIIGAVIWVSLLTLLGYFVGRIFPMAEKFILPIVLVIAVVSVMPAAWQMFKERRA